ncbi:MAG: T9SS type A sorting domain-containing protein [Chitinophagales bacterium]|nr:T9SS type A sorting domain-containing protein [Chitinophagales bacterium]
MKKFILHLLLTVILYPLVGQDYCGTVMPESYKQHLMKKDRTHLQSSSRVLRQIPIQYHIVGDDDGNGYFTLRELISLHCDLNANFVGADIEFYLYDDVRYINNDEWYVFPGFNAGDQLMNANNVNNVCNVYITEDPAGVCGYAYFPGSGPNGGGIVLNKGCSGFYSTTLSHEMGHYLGLPHTFATIGGIEFVDGSNCSNSGDLFCDTPADFLDYRWSCPYIGSQTDPNGDLYTSVLDETLFMSYSMDNCQNKFSVMQESDMNNTVLSGRPYLLNHTVPVYTNLDTPKLNSPIASINTISSQQTILEWDPVPGAEFYHVLVTHFSNPFLYDFDLFVTGTSIALDELLPGVTYRWKVKPITKANVCADYSKEETFVTSVIKADVTLTPPNCSGNLNGEIEIIPTSGKAPFFYEWSNGWFANPAFSLSSGNYDVTITDSDGNQVILNYDLIEPAALVVDVVVDDNNAVANVLGGIPPYTYLWSDGSSSNTLLNVGPGNYVVNITDANGCSASKGFVISSIGDIAIDKNLINVYPNPVHRDDFIIDVAITNSDEYLLEIINIDGKVIYSSIENLTPDAYKFEISSNELSSGLYFVSLKSAHSSTVGRFTVIR